MKKYNLSKIMKRAHEIYRFSVELNNGMTFSQALKRAWAEAKENLRRLEMVNSGKEIARQYQGAKLYMRKDFNGVWNVSGQTYAAKARLKKMGFQWNPTMRTWDTADAAVAVKFAIQLWEIR